MLNRDIKRAYKVLKNRPLKKSEAIKLSRLKSEDIFDLVSLANKVKNKFTNGFHLCSISNIKNGKCGENCSYCAQSSHFNTGIETFDTKSINLIMDEAEEAVRNGVNYFGLVSSGKGIKNSSPQLEWVEEAVNRLKTRFPNLNICLALGILDRESAFRISRIGIYHYNHNLQVNPERYDSLVSTTHSITERIDTIKFLKEYGVNICSGGIFGLGEDSRDRVELIYALKNLDISVIPINILVPIENTPAYSRNRIEIMEALKSVAIARLICPDKIIKLAAGRETILNDYQALFLSAGINGMLTGGYLTTRGRNTNRDRELLAELKL